MVIEHDPGDEDRRPTGPFCSRCGDAFDGPERDCPNAAPGRPYVDSGRGGHMFDAEDPEPAVSIAHGFEGPCEACGALVQVGDRVHVYADDVVVHERCPGSRERARA